MTIRIVPDVPPGATLVCGPASYFRDDVRTSCDWCGTAIVHRPHAAAAAIKICLACAVARHGQSVAEASITGRTMDELRAWLATKGPRA